MTLITNVSKVVHSYLAHWTRNRERKISDNIHIGNSMKAKYSVRENRIVIKTPETFKLSIKIILLLV